MRLKKRFVAPIQFLTTVESNGENSAMKYRRRKDVSFSLLKLRETEVINN